ncbi:MAG: hypothetical protein ACREBO_14435 [Novosphingobium sp.]
MRTSLVSLVLLLACPSLAAASAPDESKPAEPDKPVTERSPSMGDAALTPASDLNLRKDEIPPLLIAAQSRPYDLTGLRRCPQISAAVSELDAMLGPDFDLPAGERDKITAGRVAQETVGAFIPFRGLIREISGANAHERRLQTAIIAGSARRAFLKGYGEAKGCKYPARSVSYMAVVQKPH